MPTVSEQCQVIPKEQARMYKPIQERTYDPIDGLRLRVYCLCVNEDNNILLITASRCKDRYVVPGGGIDPGETQEQAVVRELYEEAGVKCEIDCFLQEHVNKDRNRKSFVYKCKFLSQDDSWKESREWPFRERYWAKDLDEAIELVSQNKKEHIKVLDLLRSTLD